MVDYKPTAIPIELSIKLDSKPLFEKTNPTLYRQLVESLIYHTIPIPDITYVVGIASRFMQDPYVDHWKMTKKILKYIKSTFKYGFFFLHQNANLYGYCDVNYIGNFVHKKYTSRTISLNLVQGLSHGVIKINLQGLYHPRRANIKVQ